MAHLTEMLTLRAEWTVGEHRRLEADLVCAGDAEEPFIEVVWWVNQEVLHHGAEIALLRDLYGRTSG